MSDLQNKTNTISQYSTNETALLVSTWVFAITLGVAFMQLVTYWRDRSKDHPILQFTVFGLFVNETIWTALRFVSVHRLLLVIKPGSLESFSMPKLQTISCYFANVTLLGVNLFLIYRYHRLTKRWWLSIPLAVLACASLAFHFWTNTLGIQVVDLVTSSSVDLAVLFATVDDTMRSSKIASALEFTVVAGTYLALLSDCFYTCGKTSLLERGRLLASRSVYLGRQKLKSRSKFSVLKRLLIVTVENGSVTFALTAALIAMSWSRPAPSTINILMACCARAYYHTLLFNLNMRSSSGLVMRDSQPSLGHISSALRTRDTLSSGPIQGTEIVELSCKFEFKQDYETGCAGEKGEKANSLSRTQ